MQGWPSESVSPSQLAQPARPETPDATLSKFQEMDKKLNAETGAEGMEVAEDSQVLDSQALDDSQVLGSQPMSGDDEAASDPPSTGRPSCVGLVLSLTI